MKNRLQFSIHPLLSFCLARRLYAPCTKFYLFVVILTILLTCPAVYAQSGMPGPAFRFSELLHDFGNAPTDTLVRHRFEFTNCGDAMLVITDAALSCPCFEVAWSRGPVMPGEKGWVDVAYPTTAKPGPFDKLIWVSSNAVNNPPGLDKYELRIKGIVIQSEEPGPQRGSKRQAVLKIEQSILDMGELAEGQLASKEIVIRNMGNSPLIIQRIIGSDSGVLATYDAGPILPGKKALIRIDVRGEAPGPISRTFYVLTNAINSTELWPGRTFIVKGRVVSGKNLPKRRTGSPEK